jgi:hypothetical protein
MGTGEILWCQVTATAGPTTITDEGAICLDVVAGLLWEGVVREGVVPGNSAYHSPSEFLDPLKPPPTRDLHLSLSKADEAPSPRNFD